MKSFEIGQRVKALGFIETFFGDHRNDHHPNGIKIEAMPGEEGVILESYGDGIYFAQFGDRKTDVFCDEIESVANA